MNIQIYHNPRCTKSRQSLQVLNESGLEFEIVEYLKIPLDKSQLKVVLSKLGIKAGELVRKTEAVYKEKYKDKELSEDQWIDAMTEHPKLIQRPIVVRGDKAVIGRPSENVKELLK